MQLSEDGFSGRVYCLPCTLPSSSQQHSVTPESLAANKRQWIWLFQYCCKFKLENGERFLEAVKLKGGHNYEVSSPYKLF